MGGKGGKKHHIPLGRPHGVKQGGTWGKERDLPYEASAGENSEESAEAIVPERGRAEPNNRRSTNGSRKPHPDGKRREIGIRAERRKRQTHDPSRRSTKRSEHRKSHQGRHGQQGCFLDVEPDALPFVLDDLHHPSFRSTEGIGAAGLRLPYQF